MEVLNTREIAHGIWILILCGWAVPQPEMRKHLKALFSAVFHGKLVVAYVGFALYTACAVFILKATGLWAPNLLKDTIVWFVVSGIALLFSGARSAQEIISWRKILADQVKAALLVEYLVNTYTFPL